MATIEIDGKKFETHSGKMIIEVADEMGINIPRFCYHKKLSIAANCRMCLIEVDKSKKPLPACATPVTDGMKVFTKSPMALAAQKAVMEFLLINHPLDCPICDQGGECELQDVSMGYGDDISRFTEEKRSVADENIGPLVETEMTRCIHCTRCVRFGEEVAGLRELGATGRGEHMEIGTYVKHSLQSEISANIIDLCPVGALTSKPYRYTARAWELEQWPSIAPHDCLGSHIHVHTRRNQVMRVVPKDNESINETWLSDRDRFSYLGLNSEDRLAKPMIKEQGQWHETDWQTALEFAVKNLQKIIKNNSSEQIGALISSSATTEESYLFQKLMKGLGVANIDHRTQQLDFHNETFIAALNHPNIPYAELENQQAILLVGSHLVKEQPLAAVRVRKAALRGGQVMAINPVDFSFHLNLSHKITCDMNQLLWTLVELAKIVIPAEHGLQQEHAALFGKITKIRQETNEIAEVLRDKEKVAIMLGAIALNHPNASLICALAQLIAEFSKAEIFYMTPGANSAGASLVGALPTKDSGGLNAQSMFQQTLKAYVLLGLEPELDCANPQQAKKALGQAEFVLSLSTFVTDEIKNYADVILPVAAFTETAGTFVNLEGQWQTFKGCVSPFGEARPAWKVLRVLGNLFDITGFDYQDVEEVLTEVKGAVKRQEGRNETTAIVKMDLANINANVEHNENELARIGEWPMYRGDSLVRRSKALQKSENNDVLAVRINSKLAKKLTLENADEVLVGQHTNSIRLPLVIDNRIADNCVSVPNGYAETAGLDDTFGRITLLKI